MPLKVWTALGRFAEIPPEAQYLRWVPLILAPEWADAHPDEPEPRPGTEWLRQFFDNLQTVNARRGRAEGPLIEAPSGP